MKWMRWAEKEGRSVTFEMAKTRDASGDRPYGLLHQATARSTIDDATVDSSSAGYVYATGTGDNYEEAANNAIAELRRRLLEAVE